MDSVPSTSKHHIPLIRGIYNAAFAESYACFAKEKKKKEEKKTGPRICFAQWNSSMPVEPRSGCDTLAVIRLQPLQFLGASAGQWNHGTGCPKSRFCVSFCLSTVVMEKGQWRKVWRVGPICAMENLGMVGGFVTPVWASVSVNHT